MSRYPLPKLRFAVPWRVRLWLAMTAYGTAVPLAKSVCRGNRYGLHTPDYYARQPVGGPCFCSRVQRRFDFIPF